MTSMKYSEREYIYHAGYPADGVCRIFSGTARVERAGAATLLRPDDFYEDAGFLTGADWASDEFGDGAVTFDFLRRNEFLAVLSLNLSLTMPLVSGVIDLVDRAIRVE